jgi:alpha-glucosidase (family GH31 glycosyl hydrolase)
VGAVRELRLYAPAGQEAGAAPALLYSCKEGLLGSGCAAPDANHLAWPAPLAQPAYALVDHPRFVPPSWGAAAAPADAPAPADPALAATSQYDFRNNVAGDLYLFVFGGGDLGGWHSARREFVALAGSCPLLPDYAWGTWFTYWHSYTEAEAKDDVARWESGRLPLDV